MSTRHDAERGTGSLDRAANVQMIIFGINPVVEALRAGRVGRVRVARAATGGSKRSSRWRVRRASASSASTRRRSTVMREAVCIRGSSPDLEPLRDYSVEELVAGRRPEPALIVVLDGIEDPHNIGAILRSVDAAGAHGVVRQAAARGAARRRRDEGVGRRGGGRAHGDGRQHREGVEELKDAGVWTVGLAGDAPERYDAVDLTVPTAIVLGAEGKGSVGSSGSAATAWCPSRCGERSQPECVGSSGSYAVRGDTSEADRRFRGADSVKKSP